jgi:hypothetical protein
MRGACAGAGPRSRAASARSCRSNGSRPHELGIRKTERARWPRHLTCLRPRRPRSRCLRLRHLRLRHLHLHQPHSRATSPRRLWFVPACAEQPPDVYTVALRSQISTAKHAMRQQAAQLARLEDELARSPRGLSASTSTTSSFPASLPTLDLRAPGDTSPTPPSSYSSHMGKEKLARRASRDVLEEIAGPASNLPLPVTLPVGNPRLNASTSSLVSDAQSIREGVPAEFAAPKSGPPTRRTPSPTRTLSRELAHTTLMRSLLTRCQEYRSRPSGTRVRSPTRATYLGLRARTQKGRRCSRRRRRPHRRRRTVQNGSRSRRAARRGSSRTCRRVSRTRGTHSRIRSSSSGSRSGPSQPSHARRRTSRRAATACGSRTKA